MPFVKLPLLIIKHLFVSNQFLHKNCQNANNLFRYLLLLLGAVTNSKISDAIRGHKSWVCYLGQAQLFHRVTFLGFFYWVSLCMKHLQTGLTGGKKWGSAQLHLSNTMMFSLKAFSFNFRKNTSQHTCCKSNFAVLVLLICYTKKVCVGGGCWVVKL